MSLLFYGCFLPFCFSQQIHISPESQAIIESYIEALVPKVLPPDELEYYLQNKKGPVKILPPSPTDSITFPGALHLFGEVRFGDLPVYCDLYQVNVQGSDEMEIVGYFCLTPIAGSEIIVFVLDDYKHQHKELGRKEFSFFRNMEPSISFRQLHSDKTSDIILIADLYRSVYYNEGLHIIHTQGDSLSIVFSEATVFIDHLDFDEKGIEKIDSCEVSFVMPDKNGNVRIITRSRHYTIEDAFTPQPQKPVKISEEKGVYYWDPMKMKYVKESK